jgi:signal transduction histidine kinase
VIVLQIQQRRDERVRSLCRRFLPEHQITSCLDDLPSALLLVTDSIDDPVSAHSNVSDLFSDPVVVYVVREIASSSRGVVFHSWRFIEVAEDALERSDLWQFIASSLEHNCLGKTLTRDKRGLEDLLRSLSEKVSRLEEFATTIAHDVRGPLVAICMRLDVAREVGGEALSQKIRDLLTKAFLTAEKLATLVQALYDYARLGAQATEKTVISLEKVLSGCLDDLSQTDKNVLVLRSTELPMVWGNADLLRQLFQNLICNSITYRQGDTVTVVVSCAGIERRALGEFAVISVKDNGQGMTEKQQSHALKLYGRGGIGGLGFGLSIVQRVVDIHNGTLTLQSEAGSGTEFIVGLPVHPPRDELQD